MNNIIFWFTLICFIILLIWSGNGYASTHLIKNKKEKWSELQLTVLENFEEIGVLDKETSTNKKNVYAIDTEKIGL